MSRFSFSKMTLVVAGCIWGGLPVSMASAQQFVSTNGPQNEPITEAEPLPAYGNGAAAPAPEDVGGADYAMPQQGAIPVGVAGPTGGGMRLPGKLVVPPYYNWHRVVRRPIWRAPVVYGRYWPNHYYTGGQAWSGQGAAQPLPVVQHPTDTTQMGVYYQQVPMWQPNPRMVPPTPWPWDWHHTVPAQAVYGRGEWVDPARAGYGAAPVAGGFGSGYQFAADQELDVETVEVE